MFFRLQLKAPPREAPTPKRARIPIPRRLHRSRRRSDDALGAAGGRARARLGSGDVDLLANDTTDQTRKLAFLKAGPEKEIYNPHGLQKPVSPYQLMAGTIIAASLVTGLNSDLPGFVIAQVTEHVYDTVSGRHLLIPQGSRLIGKYDNVVAFGQERALVVWQRIILPDGTLDRDRQSAGHRHRRLRRPRRRGRSAHLEAAEGRRARHRARRRQPARLRLAAATATSSRRCSSRRSQTTNRAGQRLVERKLNVQPTITVRPGWPLRVIVHKDLVLRPYRGPTSN